MNEVDREKLEREWVRDEQKRTSILLVLVLFLITAIVWLLRHLDNFFGWMPVPSQRVLGPLLVVLVVEMLLLGLVGIGRALWRKQKTGRFTCSYAEGVEQWRTKFQAYGPGKPFWPQSSYWLGPAYLILLLITFLILVLAVNKALWDLGCLPTPAIWFAAAILLAVSALLLFFPVHFVYRTLRRKVKTGSFLPTEEEMRQQYRRIFSRSCSMNSRPGMQILNTNLSCLAASIYAASPFIHYLRHRTIDFSGIFSSIGLSLAWGVMALFWIRQGFKSSACAASSPMRAILTAADILPPTQESDEQKPPMKRRVRLAWLFLPWITVLLVLGIIVFRNMHPDPVLYPPAAQAHADLAAALRTAPAAHKRILLDFGESSCGDCQAMDRFLHDPVNRALIDAHFIVVFINTDYQKPRNYDTANEDLARQYAVPLDKGIPALAVLGADGKLIFSQQNGEFEDMRHLHSSDLTAFLERWR